MTPSLIEEAQSFFRAREADALASYDQLIDAIAKEFNLDDWYIARDLRQYWRNTRLDMERADRATQCPHLPPERSHEAQRCDWCWTISTYIRLTTPKENE